MKLLEENQMLILKKITNKLVNLSLLLCLFIFFGFCISTDTVYANGERFADVWGSSSNDIFAVGKRAQLYNNVLSETAIIFHFDGSRWSEMELPIDVSGLSAVWGTSVTNVYAVGRKGPYPDSEGVVIHYNGSTWQTVMDGGLADNLYAIWGSSASDIYAVGYQRHPDSVYYDRQGVVLHYDGSVWGKIYTIEERSSAICAVWGSSNSDVFFDGSYSIYDDNDQYVGRSDDSILHFNGTTWTRMTSSFPVSDFWGSSASNVFALSPNGDVYKYNGTYWAEIREELYDHDGGGIWGSSATDIFIVGDFPNIFDNPQPPPGYEKKVFHFNGSVFQNMDYPRSIDHHLKGVWGTSASNVYAVGSQDVTGGHGFIVHYNGISWSEVHINWSTNISPAIPLLLLN